MYYTATTTQDSTKHCVGAATSGSITGPYTPQANYLYCPLDQGGAIDPSWFVDTGGQRYVVYKIDGRSRVKPPAFILAVIVKVEKFGIYVGSNEVR